MPCSRRSARPPGAGDCSLYRAAGRSPMRSVKWIAGFDCLMMRPTGWRFWPWTSTRTSSRRGWSALCSSRTRARWRRRSAPDTCRCLRHRAGCARPTRSPTPGRSRATVSPRGWPGESARGALFSSSRRAPRRAELVDSYFPCALPSHVTPLVVPADQGEALRLALCGGVERG